MKAKQRFLLAKYTPDVRRMETRNIGVIVWANGKTSSKFLPLADATAFVNEADTYTSWIEYWNGLLNKDSISLRNKPAVMKDNSEFIEEFITTQSGNYILDDAEAILDNVKRSQISNVTEYLYNDLVDQKRSGIKLSSREQTHALKSVFKSLLSEAGISKKTGLKPTYEVMCPVKNFQRHLRFSYAIMGKKSEKMPLAAIQLVGVNSPTSVNSAVLMFDSLQQSKMIVKEKCAVVVNSEDELNGPLPDRGEPIRFMEEYARVINVRKQSEAIEALRDLANAA